jgi:acid stress chaperone HdeB
MKSYRLIALAALTMVLASPVIAAEVDMTTLTCKEVSAMKTAKVAAVAAWVSGFIHGKKNSAMLDTDKLIDGVGKVKDICDKTPDATLAKAIELMSTQ